MVRSVAILAALALALPAAVNAHGSISNPKPVFKDPSNRNAPSGTAPADAANNDLKSMGDKVGACGKTDGAAPAVPIPADGVISFDISAVHVGPCEIWLGNEKVISEQECWKKFPDHKIKIDTSKCGSGCQLRWVWIAKHNIPWEVYDNCVNLGSGGGAPAPAPGPAPGPGPAVNSVAPAPAPGPAPGPAPVPAPGPAPAPAPVAGGGAGGYKYCGAARPDAAALDSWCNTNCPGFCPGDMCCK